MGSNYAVQTLSMNYPLIQRKLDNAREKQRVLRTKIDRYRKQLIDAGINPDKPKIDLVPRNKNIFKAWKRGFSFVQIAAEANLSTTRISSICKRIERILLRSPIPKEYRDLVRYRDEGWFSVQIARISAGVLTDSPRTSEGKRRRECRGWRKTRLL